MAEKQLPYMQAYGNITKGLNKIIKASTPGQFTQDYLATKLDMPGGSPRPLISFLKRIGFLTQEGSPTDRYKRFRNESQRGAAAAEAVRAGYAPLYAINEYIHAAQDPELRGAIVQHTGLEESSSQFRSILGSFKALVAFADFEAEAADDAEDEEDAEDEDDRDPPPGDKRRHRTDGLRLNYDIHLHLPATTDPAVFNAIFKSLRDNIL